MKRKLFLVISFLILAIFLTGCSGSGIVTPVTSNKSPIASFTVNPASGVAPLEVYFNASGSYDSDGSIVSYAWDFKDGYTGTGKTVNHSFSSIGIYNVELTVTDDKGATGASTNIILVSDIETGVSNQSPTASFTANPATGAVSLEVSFDASNSSDSDGNIIIYAWDFKDGETGVGMTINHTFNSIGNYNVELTVIDDKVATDSFIKTITVTESPNQSPTASFTADPTLGVAPLEVSFDASNSSDSDGTIASYTWDFKDGDTGTGEILSHIFNSTGNYNVELIIIDNDGATDSITKEIEVISGTIADGIISSNTTWTIANSPYIILNEDLQIAQGATLSIGEGIIVKFGEGRKLKVAGALKVEGSPGSPVTLTSIRDIVCDPFWSPFCSGGWVGIEFLAISDITNSSFQYAIIENANVGVLLEPAGVDINFVGNVFRNNWQAIRGGSCGNSTFEGNTFLNNDQALALYGGLNSNLIVKNNLFINNYNATRGSYQNTTFEYNTFSNNMQVFDPNAIDGLTGENWIQNNIFENNNRVFCCSDPNWFVSIFISSQTNINNNNFVNNEEVIMAPKIGDDGLAEIHNNWWGTTDTDIIDGYIIDGKDDVELQIFNYEPIKDTEISGIGSSISLE